MPIPRGCSERGLGRRTYAYAGCPQIVVVQLNAGRARPERNHTCHDRPRAYEHKEGAAEPRDSPDAKSRQPPAQGLPVLCAAQRVGRAHEKVLYQQATAYTWMYAPSYRA